MPRTPLPRSVPAPCGCTGPARCPYASALHELWLAGKRTIPASFGGILLPRGAPILGLYQMHLRAAGVWPGKAQWESEAPLC